MSIFCKSFCRFCLCGLVVLLAASQTEAHNGDKTAYAIPLENITIDGKLDDWPDEMAVRFARAATDSPQRHRPIKRLRSTAATNGTLHGSHSSLAGNHHPLSRHHCLY